MARCDRQGRWARMACIWTSGRCSWNALWLIATLEWMSAQSTTGAPVDAALGRARIVGGVLCARGAQQKQQAAADERKRGRGTGPGAGGGNLLGAHSTNVNRILAALQGG